MSLPYFVATAIGEARPHLFMVRNSEVESVSFYSHAPDQECKMRNS